MITKQMRDFMKKHGVNKLYNWMDEDYNSEAIPAVQAKTLIIYWMAIGS